MRVIIKEREYEYPSDFPHGWQYSSGDYFKYPVLIGNYKCFIKRFEKKRPHDISGWDLLNKLKYKFEPHLPRIYDIVSVEENRKQVHYVFYEYLKGATLDSITASGTPVDLQRLTNDLFSAIESIHKYDYWFADFCEKNIFSESTGRYLLLDLDSAQPSLKAPDNEMYGNKDYWALVFNFYKDILNYTDLRLADISGISLNHLQIIFLILHLKIYQQDQHVEYLSPQVFNDLPTCLDNLDPSFRELFIQAYEAGRQEEPSYKIDQIKDLIFQKIIEQEIIYPSLNKSPIILDFKASGYLVQKGETFSLDWEVENATYVEIYKDGVLIKKLGVDTKSIMVSEAYDGKDRDIVYTLIAGKDDEQTKSVPITVRLIDKEPVVAVILPTPIVPPDPPKGPAGPPPKKWVYKPPTPEALKKIRIALGGLSLAIIIAVWMIIFYPIRHKTRIFKFEPKNIAEEHTLVISGKNFPKDSNDLQVLFNTEKGKIQFNSEDFIRVSVPRLDELVKDGFVKVALVVKKDTIYAKENLFVKKIEEQVKPTPLPIDAEIISTAPKDSIRKNTNKSKRAQEAANRKRIKDSLNAIVKTPVEVIEEPKGPAVNIYELVTVTTNDFRRKTFGGIKDLTITVHNKSPFDLDQVQVQISYIKQNEKEIKKQVLTFQNVKAHTDLALDAPDVNRGSKISVSVLSIESKQIK